MSKIPKIIHQIWGGGPLPKHLQILSETWKRDYPDWKYEFWDDERVNKFVLEHYPKYYQQFIDFPYGVQRWDAVRYLILNKMGGMYVDFDIESIRSIESTVQHENCCFALDPDSHRRSEKKELMLNNALMLSISGHWFMRKIIKTIFSNKTINNDNRPKHIQVFTSAGPWMLVDLYNGLAEVEKEDIFLISDKLVSPFNIRESARFINGEMSEEEARNKLKYAHAVHYFLGDWR